MSALAIIIVISAPAIPSNAGVLTPVDIVNTPGDDTRPVASDTYVAWVKWSFNDRGVGTTSLWAMALDGASEPFLVSHDHSASLGGIDGSTLAYGDGNGDIVLQDLTDGSLLTLPEGVNSAYGESAPSISGSRLAFVRGRRRSVSVLVVDLATSELTRVWKFKDTRKRVALISAIQISGSFVAWDVFTFSRHRGQIGCDVYLGDLTAGSATRLAHPDDECPMGPGVDSAGTVFYASSTFDRAAGAINCDGNVVERPLGGDPTVIYSTTRLRRIENVSVRENADGTDDVLFDPGSCRRHFDQGEIQALLDVVTP
jgi:hypothetical protein